MNRTDSEYFMKSDRIGFAWWQPDDLPSAMELWGDPAVTRLFRKERFTKEQVAERLTKEIETAGSHGVQYWPIYCLENNEHVGCAGLRPYTEDTLELGFHLKPKFWGSGIATEVGLRIIKHAFDSRLSEAIFAGHHPDNKSSRNTLLKLGFLGTESEFYSPTGLYHPSYLLYREPQSMSTRLATFRDARALAIVHYHSIRDTFAGVLNDYVTARSLEYCEEAWDKGFVNNAVTTLVLLRAKQIVGFASVGASPDDDVKGLAGELDRVYIHPSLCGNGYGGGLIEWCSDTARERGFKMIKLWVFEVNARARHVYEKHGFKPDGCAKEAYNATLLRYEKDLEPTGGNK